MRSKLILLVVSIFLTSCSYFSHQSIAQRHLDKIGLEVCDTVTIHDTTVVTESRTDTVLRISEISHDTIIIREGQSEVKYFYNTHDSTIYIEGKCHDTIIVDEREVQTRVVYRYAPTNNWYKWFFIGCMAVSVLILIAWRIKK